MNAAATLLLALVLVQDGTKLSPTPPPDRYDPEHDAMLRKAWGEPFDPELAPQARPLRPQGWRLLSVSDSRGFLLQNVVPRLASAVYAKDGRTATMPDEGELRGSFTFASTTVDMERDEIRFVRAPGAELVFVNGDGFVGDPDRRGWLGVPVYLRRGANQLIVGGIRGGFELEFWDPVTRIVMASWAVEATSPRDAWPDAWDHLQIPLFNAATFPADRLHVHYGYASTRNELPRNNEWRDGGYAFPLALVRGTTYAFNVREGVPPGDELLAPVIAYDGADEHAERRLLLLRRDSPRPSWPAPAQATWPPDAHLLTLVAELTPDPAWDDELIAVARFCQQRLWERSGILAPLIPETYLEAHRDHADERGTTIGRSQILRLGLLEGDEPGVLRAGSERVDESRVSYFIRASNADALRLVYVVEPFFRELGEGSEAWRVP